MNGSITKTITSDNQTQQIDNEQGVSAPLKRLKLTLPDDTNDLYGLLVQKLGTTRSASITNHSEIINLVLEFTSNYHRISNEFNYNEEEIIQFLINQFENFSEFKKRKEETENETTLKLKPENLVNNEICVQTVLLKCISKLFKSNKMIKFIDKFIYYLTQTKNNKLILELLRIIDVCLEIIDNNSKIKADLLPFIKKFLKNSDHRLREICLKIMALRYIDYETFSGDNKMMNILLLHSEDQDARVRVKSLELLIQLHEKGYKIGVSNYEILKHRLTDDYDQVRLLAIKVIWLLALTYPEHMVDIGTGLEVEELRFIDEAFAKVCNMVNDLSLEVKVEASKRLGEMNGVSTKFLLQTLDKKILKDLRVKSTQQKATLFSSEWSTTSVIPTASTDAQIQDDESISLISTGACGAFIHGLEDEFLEVRGECVNSLCKLAVNCPELSAKSIDFLVDMFNDEIDTVRLIAVQGMAKIAHYVLLNDDHVDIILPTLEDGSLTVRESLRDLLSTCKLATKNALKKCTQALFNNYKKYSIDRMSIGKCFQHLGRNHSKFVLSLATYFLGLHPFFEKTQPDMNDPLYIFCLILIFNAAKVNPTIASLLPKYVFDHYFYLRAKQPDIVPSIEIIDDNFNSNEFLLANQSLDINSNEVTEFFQNIINNLKIANSINNDECKLNLYKSILNDLNHLAQIEQDYSASCEIMYSFIKCLVLIKEFEQQNEMNLNKLDEALLLSVKLLSFYKGYTKEEKINLYELNHYLKCLFLKQLHNLKKSLSMNNFNIYSLEQSNLLRRDLIKECRNYLNYLRKYQLYLINLPEQFRNSINSADHDNSPMLIIDLLSSSLFKNLNIGLLILNQPKNLRKLSIDLLEPVENIEIPIRYTPGLVCAVKLKALLHNFTRFDNLYIQIKYSDYEIQYIPIDTDKVKRINSTKHSLEMDVLLSHSTWTESSYIKLCMSMLINDEVFNEEDEIVQLSSNNESINNGMIIKSKENFIELTKIVKIHFEPNPRKFNL